MMSSFHILCLDLIWSDQITMKPQINTFQFNDPDHSTGDNSNWKFQKSFTCDLKFTLWTSCNQIFKSFYWIVHEKRKSNEKNDIFVPHFYIQSFSLTECIVIVGVGKTGDVCLSVCASVCVCVCLSVCARTPKLLGRFYPNFAGMVPSRSSCARLCFGSLT